MFHNRLAGMYQLLILAGQFEKKLKERETIINFNNP